MKVVKARLELQPLFRDVRWHRLRAIGRELRPYLKPVQRDLLLALLCSVGSVVMVVARPWPIKVVLDYAILPTGRVKWVFPYHLMKGNGAMGVVTIACAFLFIVSLLWGLFAFYQRYLVSAAGQKITSALRRRLFVHLQRLSVSYHHRQRVGDLLLRATGDTTMLREMLVDTALIVMTECLVLLAMLAVMFYLDWQLTMIGIAVLPLLGLAVFHVTGNLRTAIRRQRKKEGRVAALFGEMLQSIAVIQSFGRETHSLERFKGSNQQALRQGLRTVRLEANLERSAEFLIAVGTGGVLWFGVDRVLDGVLTPGDLVVFTSYLAGMYRPLRRIARVAGRLSKAMASSERVFAVLRVQDRVKVHPLAVPAPRLRGRVAFKRVSFAYERGRPVLRGVTFSARPGQTVALVGPNGAGKSTLCALIPRLFDPAAGRIAIDGQKLSRYTLESLREQIGVVLQEPLLFAATVRDNIAFGKPDATMDEIVAAARLAEAHDFIAALPDGYDTVVGERGSTLSVGQRQKIAIARAVVKDPAILILDEPTAALDPTSAAQINDTLAALAHGRTTFRVTHRLAEVQSADLILVFQDGAVVQQGTHKALMAAPGWYRSMFELQASAGVGLSPARQAPPALARASAG